MKRKIISLILFMAIIIPTIGAPVYISAGPSISSQGACVMDFQTGEVLYEYNGNTPRVPASMTKIMNMYCIYEALANREITLNTVVPISKNVYDKSRNSTYQSVLPLYYNQKYTVDEMISVIVTYSASGAAIAMAELIGGSEEAYVQRMNNKAAQMGLDAYYYDSCGIANNKISPISMAKLARNIIKDYPDIINRASKKTVTFHGNTYKTTNRMLDTYLYEGLDGLKTGTTTAAGYCFCGTAVRNGRRLISVTMSSSSTSQRFTDTAALLDYGFSVSSGISSDIIKYTDMRTFINGNEIPTFAYEGNGKSHAVIIAEELANYGFDINFNSEMRTLILSYNPEKAVTPTATSYFKNKNGQKAFDIATSSDVKVIIDNGEYFDIIHNAYNINGFMAISVDELANFFGFDWSNRDKTGYIDTAYLKSSGPTREDSIKPSYSENTYAQSSYTSSGSKPAASSVRVGSGEGTIYYTDVSTYLNGNEIPTFMFKGDSNHAVIVAEDLANYGFDLHYDVALETLYAVYNSNQAVNPMPTEYYKGKNGQAAFDVLPSNVRMYIDDGYEKHFMSNIYNINGYLCVSVDEFSKFADHSWDSASRTAYITMRPTPSIEVEAEPIPEKQPDAPAVESAAPTVPAPAPEVVTETAYNGATLPNGEKLTSASAYIMDYDTGKMLYGYKENIRKPVASIAKMMSVYVIMDAIKDGKISLDTKVPISENVYKLSRVEDYKMMVNLEYDETYTVDEMIDMIIIDSAAACVTAMAELIAGSETEFVKLMNKKAAEIGIGSVFYNGTGVCLNPETDKENLMSAAEVALMTKAMIDDYPQLLERTKRASVDFHGKTYYNLNKLFTDYKYPGADGFKNGMTNASGYCMCGTATIDGKRVITVTLPSATNEARFTDTIKMFDYGFAQLGANISSAKQNPAGYEYVDEGNIKINIDGNYEMNFGNNKPVFVNEQIMVPVRQMMETLGKKVSWVEAENKIVISDENTIVELIIDTNIMTVSITNPYNGTSISHTTNLKAAPAMINHTTYAPLKEIAEIFGAAVIYEQDTATFLVIAGVC